MIYYNLTASAAFCFMFGVSASNAVGRGFPPRPGHTTDHH